MKSVEGVDKVYIHNPQDGPYKGPGDGRSLDP